MPDCSISVTRFIIKLPFSNILQDSSWKQLSSSKVVALLPQSQFLEGAGQDACYFTILNKIYT